MPPSEDEAEPDSTQPQEEMDAETTMEALADDDDDDGDDEGSAHSDAVEEAEDEEEEEDAKTKGSASIQKPRPIPVKRARLAYSIFCDEKRPEIQDENPDMDTEAVAAELNKLWRELSEDDQLVYREKAEVEHDEVAQKQQEYEAELKAWKAAGGILEDDSESNPPPKPPPKPVKKAATAYFLFSSEKRTQLRAENPGASVAVIAKELGKLWNALSDEEKRPYNEKAAEERERVAQELVVWEKEFQEYEAELKAWKVAGGELEDEPIAASYSPNLIFPVARIKKIAKLDPEVRGISKDALLLITKCAELATSKLGTESVRVARAQNRRKLLPEDVAQVCSTREQFIFLKDDIKDLVREMLPTKTDKNDQGKAAAQNRADANIEAAAGTKRLASYFGGDVDGEGSENAVAPAQASKRDKKESGTTGGTNSVAKKNVDAAKGTKPLTSYFVGTNKA